KLAGNVIPQAHPTGYPVYRLEWQSLGSLQRRLRNCLGGIRAEAYEDGSPALVDPEVFLMWRARGIGIATPGAWPQRAPLRDAGRSALAGARARRRPATDRQC